jgi:hypothetical protein
MEGSYYFSQGRLISNYPYKNDNTKETKDTDKENKDKNDDWMKIFKGYKFQIFSPSILRYK